MAVEAVYLNMLLETVKLRRRAAGAGQLTALALGYPDLLVPAAALEKMLGVDLVGRLGERGDAEAIWAWHGLKGCREPLYDSIGMFEALGIDVTVCDIVAARGMERIVDLNEKLPDDLEASFDFVIDTGTCEHCFNVGMAFRNACEAVKIGGFLVHAAPLNRYNHGFWNFSPTVYPDYFEDNGFRLHLLTGIGGNIAAGFSPFAVEPFTRFEPQTNAALYVVAERVERRPPVWPVQRKYRS
jgi:SAM-dependent methyltransferase